MAKNIEGRVSLFLKPVNKQKLNLLALANGKTMSQYVDWLIEKENLDLSKFNLR